MTLRMDRKTLETEFRPEELITLPTATLAQIRHEPSAHFLRHIGIPARPNPWFDFVDGASEQVRTIRECYDDIHDRWTNLPDRAESWLVLGMIPYDDVVLDGENGVVHCLPGDASDAYPLSKDLYSFAHFLYLLEQERPNYDFESDQETVDPAGAARRLAERMRDVDPDALAVTHSRWHDILEHVACPDAR